MKANLVKTALLVGVLSSTSAFAVSITTGNPGGSFDNVLVGSVTDVSMVQGTFNGANSNFLIDFTSSSGSGLLSTAGNGQASVVGGTGNSPFQQLSLVLENGTFTSAVLNPDAVADGNITFTVNYLNAALQLNQATFALSSSGNNFFGFEAGQGEVITGISFVSDVGVSDLGQVRLAGLAAPTTPTPTPDGGATIGLAGIGLLALSGLRSKFRK